MSAIPEWFDPAMPNREQCVVGPRLEAICARHPDRVFAKFQDGRQWTYAQTLNEVKRWAHGLQKLGVKRGDSVLVWLPNGQDIVRGWFAANYLGAIYAPINTAYRGDLLEHVIANSGARLMIAHPSLLSRLKGINLSKLELVIAVQDATDDSLPVAVQPASVLDGNPAALEPVAEVMPWDTQAIIYTSGTTGPSKGVYCSFLHFYTIGILAVGFIEPEECCLVHMPLFHIGAAGGVIGCLARGASIAVVDGFSTNQFWTQIKEMNCAVACGLVGSVVPFLASREPQPDDKDNPLRRTLVAPISPQIQALAERHDFEYFSGFGMTEAPIPLITRVNPTTAGNCGVPRSGVECRIVDEHDIEVPRGAVGELIVRSDLPWSQNHGYVDNPEATVEAWRNGWFHTGDAFMQDEDGRYFFVDRMKDTIRRRGENISSLEVEKVVLEHPAIVDVAAIPVPSEYSEDEVMIVVEPASGQTVDPKQLIEFLVPRMAHFMIPRYIRFMHALPKTPTDKVRKPLLREEGITPDSWDRESAGIVIKRDKLT